MKYKPRAVAEYIDDLAKPIVAAQLERIASKGRAELMSEYFQPASSVATARSLGFGEANPETLLRWFHGTLDRRGELRERPEEAGDRGEPDGSALSHMLHDGMPEGQTRSRAFLLPSIKVALLGGMQEPGHGAGSVLVGLLTHPAQMRDVLADLDRLLPKAVDEGLRWVAPIGTQMRQTTEPVTLGGVTIPTGSPVASVLSSASRDESRTADPDAFDIHRGTSGHAAYGFGSHFCAGRWFAQRLMAAAAAAVAGAPAGFETGAGEDAGVPWLGVPRADLAARHLYAALKAFNSACARSPRRCDPAAADRHAPGARAGLSAPGLPIRPWVRRAVSRSPRRRLTPIRVNASSEPVPALLRRSIMWPYALRAAARSSACTASTSWR